MHKTRQAIDQQQAAENEYKYKTIIYIGPEGKATWIGSVKGLKNMYPFAKVVKIEEDSGASFGMGY